MPCCCVYIFRHTYMDIWQEIAANQESGARRLAAECGDRLFAAAVVLCRDRNAAEDLVFRTFVRAIRRIKHYREEAPFYNWLYAILLNIHRSDCRKKKAEVLETGEILDDVDPVWINLREPIDPDEAQAVRTVVQSLPSPFCETVLLRYFEDKSLAEISELTSVPIGTVKSRLKRAQRRLNDMLSGVLGRSEGGTENELS